MTEKEKFANDMERYEKRKADRDDRSNKITDEIMKRIEGLSSPIFDNMTNEIANKAGSMSVAVYIMEFLIRRMLLAYFAASEPKRTVKFCRVLLAPLFKKYACMTLAVDEDMLKEMKLQGELNVSEKYVNLVKKHDYTGKTPIATVESKDLGEGVCLGYYSLRSVKQEDGTIKDEIFEDNATGLPVLKFGDKIYSTHEVIDWREVVPKPKEEEAKEHNCTACEEKKCEACAPHPI
jgi:hypothetical protein